jgi:uncharacterized protein
MPSTVTSVLKTVLDEYSLNPNGIHGIVHWARVFENGIHLSETTGANIEITGLVQIH